MSTFARLAALELEIQGFDLEPLEEQVASAFVRRTTVIRLHGGGVTGVGEDVTWGDVEQLALAARPPAFPTGSFTLESFSDAVAGIDLYPAAPPQVAEWRYYRRWALESAALDLALRQAGRSLAEVLEREPAPVHFVVSPRLGDPPAALAIENLLELYPHTRFKLDPTTSWDDSLLLALGDRVDVLDFKSAYTGTYGEQPADPAFYRRIVRRFPEALIEDPNVRDPATAELLEPHRDRITWDAPIHSVDDVRGLPFAPRMLNSKPSRFGSVRAVLDFYDYCSSAGIGLYGGGQFELGPGRGHVQTLASLFHPDAPNDVAPSGYNAPAPAPGLETSPLDPLPPPQGFGRLPVSGSS